MKKVVVIFTIVMMVMTMVITTATAYKGNEFCSFKEAVGRMGISRVVILEGKKLTKEGSESVEESTDYVRTMCGFEENEDAIFMQLKGDYNVVWAFIYDIDEKELRPDDREILGLICIIIV